MAILDDWRKYVKNEKERVRRMRRMKNGMGGRVGNRVERKIGVRVVKKRRA